MNSEENTSRPACTSTQICEGIVLFNLQIMCVRTRKAWTALLGCAASLALASLVFFFFFFFFFPNAYGVYSLRYVFRRVRTFFFFFFFLHFESDPELSAIKVYFYDEFIKHSMLCKHFSRRHFETFYLFSFRQKKRLWHWHSRNSFV